MQEEQKNIFKFIARSFLFTLPLIIFFGGLTLSLYYSGELTPISKVIQAQKNSEKPVLLGLAYSNPDSYFKMESVLTRNPEIIALGPSRVMQFRSMFFKESGSFYNAGGVTERIEDYNYFLDKIPEGKEPKIIIVGFDHQYFNPNRNNSEEILGFAAKPKFWGVWQTGITGLLKDYIKRKFSLSDIFFRKQDVDKIGLNAIINNDGFLNDGSYHYSKFIKNPQSNPDYQFKDTFERINNGVRRFQYSNEVSEKATVELEKFLQKAKERNIHIIGFLPPYAHAVYEKMMSMGDKYGYILKIKDSLDPAFKKYEFKFYDFSDINSIGSNDKETIDGFHGTEKAYLRLFLLMLEKDKTLKQVADKTYLEKMLENTKNDYYVFEINEI